ncbi:hypothetical protein [Streptosporangium sp. KLBMP 9127]|nr:hypothetical protein [Streptosporangium sp. KLBMP 9127]
MSERAIRRGTLVVRLPEEAARASEPKGTVTLGVRPTKNAARVSVASGSSYGAVGTRPMKEVV